MKDTTQEDGRSPAQGHQPEVPDPDHIGYLIDANQVCCRDCAWKTFHGHEGGSWSKLYRVNIGSYWQSCHTCGKMLVEGQGCGKILVEGQGCGIGSHQHTHWCELFPKRDTSLTACSE